MDIFSNLMIIGECLLDARRTTAFQRAIATTVKPPDIVVDIGTGSGILAMMAARAGAKRVYAVDIAPDIVRFARTNIVQNKLHKVIQVHRADAKQFRLSRPVDVVMMELMDTWLVGEQQAVVLNELRKNHVIGPQTRLVPYRYQCAVNLIEYDFSFYGFTMPFVIQARNFGVLKRITRILSDTIIVQDIDFQKPIKTRVNESIPIGIKKGGVGNALLLKAKTFLAPGIALWGTTDMNMPVIVPIKKQVVHNGQHVTLRVRYAMGAGFKTFTADLKQQSRVSQ